LLWIDGLVDAAHAIPGGIERVLDHASANGVVPGARWDERPAESRIDAAARFFVRHQPLRGAEVHAAQHELACAKRQDNRDRRIERTSRRTRDRASDTRPREERERDAECGHHDTDEHFEHDVPRTRQKPRRQEVAVEPSLIGGERAAEERAADRGDRDLDNHTRGQMFGTARSIKRR